MMMEFGKRMSKPHSLFGILKGCVLHTNPKVFTSKRIPNACKLQKSKYDLSKHQGIETLVLIRQSKEFDFIKR